MANAENDVLVAADHLIRAFARHDPEQYFAAFAPDATFVFHNLDRWLRSRAEYEAEWRRWETQDGFRVLACESSDRAVMILGAVAIFTHAVRTTLLVGGETAINSERETIVFARGDDGAWLAVHEHLSARTASG